jgi:apolipoprotein D and lipocalin family protein
MKRFVALALLAVFSSSCTSQLPLRTAGQVSLKRYSGKWFEVAHFPKWFQRGCVSATAEYTPLADRSLRIVNTCLRADGSQRSITGSAQPVDAAGNRLRVRFSTSPLARLIPVPAAGNYWVIDVSPDYRYAIVGDPSRNSLWLLARTPSIPATEFARMKKIAAAEGFDTARLTIDRHTRLTRR